MKCLAPLGPSASVTEYFLGIGVAGGCALCGQPEVDGVGQA
jgi:hypothetical protein